MGEVKLRNGTLEKATLVAIVMSRLESLIEARPLVFHDLVMRCREEDYLISSTTEGHLRSLELLDSDGAVHDSDRNVILSATEGDGANMVLRSPIWKISGYDR